MFSLIFVWLKLNQLLNIFSTGATNTQEANDDPPAQPDKEETRKIYKEKHALLRQLGDMKMSKFVVQKRDHNGYYYNDPY